jgi:triphosphatase
MDIEIELKFLVSVNSADVLAQLISSLSEQQAGTQVSYSCVTLANTYYDTEEKLLRQHDIGMRTRNTDGSWQQTIKTAGKVVGGLHQRPEFNVQLSDGRPQLALFDSDIFPHSIDIARLQTSLIELFTTDFERQIWRIKTSNSEFEVVFDFGQISCEDQQTPICEIEMELVTGDAAVLFDFSRRLLTYFDTQMVDENRLLRLGYQSKAARGYQLRSGEQLKERAYLSQVPLAEYESLESGFVKTIEYGLAFMQHHEQCFIDNPSLLALRRFTDGAALIRHSMWLFSTIIPPDFVKHFRIEIKWLLSSFDWVEHGRQLKAIRSKTGKYRKKLERNSALAELVAEETHKEPSLDGVKQFFSQPRYNQFLLDLSQWLTEKRWQSTPEYQDSQLDELHLEDGAVRMLNEGWNTLLTIMPKKSNLTPADYIAHHKQLKRSLMTGSCVGGLFFEQQRDDFRMPWLDLSRGIDELKTLDLLQSLAQRVDGKEGRATISWLEQQIQSLLLAMEQSRKSATKTRPYWLA